MIRPAALSYMLLAVCASLSLMSCELATETPTVPQPKAANHVVINEVFTLPPSNPSSYSWIEFYNPTSQTVSLDGGTLEFYTRQQAVVRDTAGNVRSYSDRQGSYEIPFGYTGFEVPPNGFVTIVNNESRLLTFTEYGPGRGPKINVGYTIGQPPDTISVDLIRYVFYDFNLRTKDQLVLRDSLRQVVDVVRYGDYVYPGPGQDPYPDNHSAGSIPEYQSLARYAGGYSSGNTAEDFYITGVQIPLTRPIPHYYSQARHP